MNIRPTSLFTWIFLCAMALTAVSCSTIPTPNSVGYYRLYNGDPLPPNQIATLVVPSGSPLTFHSIDGKNVKEIGRGSYLNGCYKFELAPGIHAITVSFTTSEKTGTFGGVTFSKESTFGPTSVEFDAKAGSDYQLAWKFTENIIDGRKQLRWHPRIADLAK